MKKIFFVLIIILIYCGSNAQKPTRGIENIDQYDTVVFDLSKTVLLTDNYFEVPVFIKSDDDVQALDFWFKYNHKNLRFDSIIDYTGFPSQQISYNEHPVDSIVRVSCNSFSKYPKAPLEVVGIRFKLIGQKTDTSDFDIISALLNGTSCSQSLVAGEINISVDINKVEGDFYKIYPNPASKILNIEATEGAVVKLFDLSGHELINKRLTYPEMNLSSSQLEISELSDGIYIAQFITDVFVKSLKIVVYNR